MNHIYKILLIIVIIFIEFCGSSSGFKLNTENTQSKLIYGREEIDKKSIEDFFEGNSVKLEYNYSKRGRNSPNKSCFLYMTKNGRTECLRKEEGTYENIKSSFSPDYIYKTEVMNFGYTSENIEIDFNSHCPSNLEQFIIIKKDTSDNIISFLTLQLYSNTEFIILCKDPNRKSSK
jgi:hypothetical protein